MSKLTSTAVMNRRSLGPESLEYFPTPLWATRAFINEILAPRWGGLLRLSSSSCFEPCCGEGHMVVPLREAFGFVAAADVHDYGRGFQVADVLDPATKVPAVDWVITNPPFSLAEQIAPAVLTSAAAPSLALLVRLNWAEGQERHRQLFNKRPPSLIAQYADRVPMMEGAYDPELSSATAYAWFVWFRGLPYERTEFTWIPPGMPRKWFRAGDLELAAPGEAARRRAARKADEAAVGGATEITIDLFGSGGPP
jgi:hypothetical protein